MLGLGRRFRPRRNGADREQPPGAERSGSGNGDSANGAPPLVYRDGEEGPLPPRATPKPSRTPKPAREPDPEREPRTPAPSDDDWFSLADDNLADGDLDSIAAPDDGPAGPRTPREGRNLAREARRRATGKSTSFDAVPARRAPARRRLAPAPEQDFESVLESQPQKSGIAKRGSAVVYGLRGLLDHGRERVRGAGDRISHLREHVPGRAAKTAPGGNGAAPPRLPKRIGSRRPRRPKPGQVKKLRLAVIIVGLGILALVSTVFGMMVSVAGDIPQLENKEQYAKAKNSEVFDSEGRRFGTLLSNSQRILVESEDISPYIKQAVVAIEDQRFYEHRGVDYQGIGRAALAAFIPGGSTQGASTITQQFVKNALEAQSSRTYFQKLREAAYAYHLERQWDKDKILTQYLNTIYFGEGAYGIEAAARTYFGFRYPGCGEGGADPCAAELAPEEAAMLAGIISSPSAYSPRANPNDAGERRNLVLQKMNEQNVLSDEEYEEAARQALPASSEIEKPEVDSLAPYFSEWLRQQLVDKYGPGRAFGGGLDVRTTLDLDMQEAAQSAAYNTLAGIEPTASVVVIDNETGGVKAMVGGNDFEKEPFNLATNGHRQPGSSFKPFTLITAFQNGFGPSSTFPSAPQTFTVPELRGQGVLRGEELRRHLLRRLGPGDRDRPLRQLDLRPAGLRLQRARPQGPPEGRRDGGANGDRRQQLRHQPRDDPRRYRPRRHPARDGLRVQHDRPRRHARRWRARLQLRPQQLAGGPVPHRHHRGGAARRRGARRRQGLQPEGDARDPRERRRAATARSCAATSSAAPASWPRPAATTPGARREPPTTTATPGSAAAPSTSPPASGSGTPRPTPRWRPSTPEGRWTAVPSRRSSGAR